MSGTTAARDFANDGFVVLPDFKSAAEIEMLRERAEQIVDAFDPTTTRSVFSTRDEKRATIIS